MSFDKVPHGFEQLIMEARNHIKLQRALEQVIAVLTSKSNIYSFANNGILSGNNADEEEFARMLVEIGDTEIKNIVCMWRNYELDIPSQNMRLLLIKINPENVEAEVLLKTDKSFSVKAIKTMIP